MAFVGGYRVFHIILTENDTSFLSEVGFSRFGGYTGVGLVATARRSLLGPHNHVA